MTADFVLLYPPYNWVARPRRSVALQEPAWIPASAGITRPVQQDAAGSLGVSPNSLYSPKIGGQGVEKVFKDSLLSPLCTTEGH
jgi:hypothetical protein